MKKKDFVLGALIGSVASGIAVALTTPKTGNELREDIKNESQSLYEDGMRKKDEILDMSEDVLNESKAKFAEIKETSMSKVDELKETSKEKVEEVKSKIKKEESTSDLEKELDSALEEIEM